MTNDELHTAMKEGFQSLHQRFDALNGRVRDAEQDIARLDERTKYAQGTASKWGGVSGSIGGLLGGFFAGLMSGK